MLMSGATSKNCATTMNLRRIIQTDITASAAAHLALLALLLLFSEVHRFGEVTAETVAVDIVTPSQVEEGKPEPPKAQPSDAFDLTLSTEAIVIAQITIPRRRPIKYLLRKAFVLLVH